MASVSTGSIAALARLQVGDIIQSLDDLDPSEHFVDIKALNIYFKSRTKLKLVIHRYVYTPDAEH